MVLESRPNAFERGPGASAACLWRVGSGDLACMGIGGDFQARVERELFQDIVDVALDRVGGNVQLPCDCLVAQAVCNECDDLLFTSSHAYGLNRLTARDR